MNIRSKTIIISIFISFLISNISLGQNVYLIGGLNLSNLHQQKDDPFSYNDKSYRPGFHIGCAFEIELNEQFDFIPGMMFSLKRQYSETTVFLPPFDFQDSPDIIHSKSTSNEYYLDLPISMKFNFIVKDLSFYVLGGPYLNLLLFDSSTAEYYLNEEPTEFDTLEGKFTNRIDYGINMGIGVDLKSFLIQASYDYGFNRTMKYKDSYFELKDRNSVLRLTMGYKLNI